MRKEDLMEEVGLVPVCEGGPVSLGEKCEWGRPGRHQTLQKKAWVVV